MRVFIWGLGIFCLGCQQKLWAPLCSENQEIENILFYHHLPLACERGFVGDKYPVFSFDGVVVVRGGGGYRGSLDRSASKRREELCSAAHLWRKLFHGWDTVDVFVAGIRQNSLTFMNEELSKIKKLLLVDTLALFERLDEESKRATLLAMHDEFVRRNLNRTWENEVRFSDIFRRHILEWDRLMHGLCLSSICEDSETEENPLP